MDNEATAGTPEENKSVPQRPDAEGSTIEHQTGYDPGERAYPDETDDGLDDDDLDDDDLDLGDDDEDGDEDESDDE